MPEWILQILIVSIIVPSLGYLGFMLKKIIDAKIDAWLAASDIKKKEEVRAAFSDALNKLSNAVFTSVMETQRTFVAAIEKAGELTTAQKEEAFQLSYTRVKEIMSNASLEIIQNATGSLEQLIKAQIEAQLPTVKVIVAQSVTPSCPAVIQEE